MGTFPQFPHKSLEVVLWTLTWLIYLKGQFCVTLLYKAWLEGIMFETEVPNWTGPTTRVSNC
jgi:hypothetical protein